MREYDHRAQKGRLQVYQNKLSIPQSKKSYISADVCCSKRIIANKSQPKTYPLS